MHAICLRSTFESDGDISLGKCLDCDELLLSNCTQVELATFFSSCFSVSLSDTIQNFRQQIRAIFKYFLDFYAVKKKHLENAMFHSNSKWQKRLFLLLVVELRLKNKKIIEVNSAKIRIFSMESSQSDKLNQSATTARQHEWIWILFATCIVESMNKNHLLSYATFDQYLCV